VKCHYCKEEATWQSRVDFNWLCGECHPCWCDYCMGKVNAHGKDAKALHRAKIEALKSMKSVSVKLI
jgi:hypothetical protein